jgi:hypothetical protein
MTAESADPELLLEGIFSSRVRVKVLTLLFTGEAGRIHARELAKITGEHFNAVWQELKHLESLGVLRSERVGNHVDYLPNPEMPLLRELRQLLASAAGGEPPSLVAVVPLEKARVVKATLAEAAAVPGIRRTYPSTDPALVMGETD